MPYSLDADLYFSSIFVASEMIGMIVFVRKFNLHYLIMRTNNRVNLDSQSTSPADSINLCRFRHNGIKSTLDSTFIIKGLAKVRIKIQKVLSKFLEPLYMHDSNLLESLY